MKRLWILLLGGVSVLCLAGSASAGYVPSGVQNDVPLDTILNDWGWTIVYRGDYRDDDVSLDTMFGGATGDYIMLAGIQDGSSTVDVLAAALKTDVFTHTPLNTPHTANGAEWYYNGYSMGFAGLGDTIVQDLGDINGLSERDRLSWHTYPWSHIVPPTAVGFGFRSGSNFNLNDSTDWDRMVLTYTGGSNSTVPAPGAVLLGTLGAGLVGWMRRRRTL